MFVRLLIACTLLGLGMPVVAASGEDETPPIFRLSVSLVQLDAIVTDRRGNHVTGLGPDDFEVLQDGEPQRVVAAYYVPLWEAEAGDPDGRDGDGAGSITGEMEYFDRPEDARRVLALVVDDLRISFGDFSFTRRALRGFVRQHLRPGDLAGVVTTSALPGTSEPLTFRHAAVEAAISRLSLTRMLRWVGGSDAFAGLDRDSCCAGVGELRRRMAAAGALQRVEDVIDLMEPLPGRKTVVLISPGFDVGMGVDGQLLLETLRRLTDRANRAGVAIYAVDPRGLINGWWAAADDAHDGPQGHADGIARGRMMVLGRMQDGLRYLTSSTGGFAVTNANDIRRHLGRVLDDLRGYYLIGYEPPAGTFDSGDLTYRRLKVTVNRPHLKVRSRGGFYAVPTGP